jgi:hypothetical protein
MRALSVLAFCLTLVACDDSDDSADTGSTEAPAEESTTAN